MRWFLIAALAMTGTAGANDWTLDEAPAEPGNWGYRPAEGDSADVNPPGFTWRPTDGAAFYTLEVARDAAFADVVYRVGETEWNAHGATESFAPGAYHWRYRAVNKAGEATPWSAVRSFTVPAEAPAFPKPSAETIEARLAVDHPRLFFLEDDLPRLQSLAEGTLADRWDALKKSADNLLENPPDTSEPPLYPEDIVVKSDEWRQIWWGNRRHAIAVADGAATLAFAYRISGDERYGRAACDLLMALTEWDVDGSTNYRYNDEAAMPLLYYPSRAYTWAEPLLTDEERAAVIKMMQARGKQCFDHLTGRKHLWNPYASHSNRAWHFLGEVAIAFYDVVPEAPRWLDFSMTIFYTCYPVWSDAHGAWHEGAAYWSSYLNRFMYWAKTVDAAFDIDVFDRPFFQRTGYYGMYLLPPGSKYGGFSDQAPRASSSSIANLMAVFAAGARNPHWQWYAEQSGGDLGSGYMGYLWAAQSTKLEAAPPTGLPSSAVFPGVGLALLNTNLLDGTNNTQIHFKSSPMGRQSHGYNANNSFLLTMNGEGVFIRSGRRDVHGSPHHTEWMWHSKSDNAILVGGKGQKKHSPSATGEITHFETSPAVDIVEGTTHDAESGLSRWVRRIVFLKPNVIVMHDRVELEAPDTVHWLLHAPGAFEIGEGAARWEGKPGTVDVEFISGQSWSISQTDEFDTPPAEWTNWDLGEWHLNAITNEPAQEHDIITLFRLNGTAVDAEVRPDGTGATEVVLGLEDRTTRVVLEPNGVRWVNESQ